jgi:hypothetical protein
LLNWTTTLLTSLAVDGRVPRASHVAVVGDAQEAMLDVVEHAGGYASDAHRAPRVAR